MYQITPVFKLTVTREGTRLFTQATNQSRIEVFPAAEAKFFTKVIDAQIDFQFDAGDAEHASSLVLHQNGHDVSAKRVRAE